MSQDQIWNRVTINRAEKKSTRYYMDEFHLLLKEEQTAAYSVEIWKRFRKWGGIPTAITQNIKDLLASREVENIFENSDFVLMLNQAQGDRAILAKQLNISPQQMKYVTHTEAGEGLIFYGNVVLPFIDRFPTDTEAELELIESECQKLGVNVKLSEVWAKGGEGALDLADEVMRLIEQPSELEFAYEDGADVADALEAVATKVYRADGVVITAAAKKQIQQLTELGFDKMPICMAKTQFSFSDDASKLGAPRGFKITVREVKVNAGAGFLVAKTGDIMTMPGLPKVRLRRRST